MMLRAIATRASGLARSTSSDVACFNPAGYARSICSATYLYGSLHGPLAFDGLPLAVDWRKAGVVSAADDQLAPKSCWAHVAAGAVESLNAIKTGVLTKLSVQQLRECCNKTNSMKGGGNVANAFDYIRDNGGLVPDVVYRFQPEIGLMYKHIEADAVTVDGCYYDDNATEDLLRKFVAYRPVCTTICADSNFELSSDKILRGAQYDLAKAEKLRLTHDILVIGYGMLDGIPVWIIKNSWGKEWGDFGFRYIIRNEGAFGIGKEISFPMKYTRNRKCKVRSEFDIGFGKHWYFVAKDWPRYNVDVGQMVDQTMDMDRMP